MDSEKRSANILIRAAPSLKERAQSRSRKREARSLSAWIEGLIVDRVAAADAERPEPTARKRGRVMEDQRQEA